MKICSTCKISKELCEFNKNKSQKDGLCNYCRVCGVEYKKEFRNKNPNYGKQYNEENKERISEMQAVSSRAWYLKNKKKKNEQNRQWKLENREKIRLNEKEKLDSDLNFKLSKNLRTRIRAAIKDEWKSGSAIEDLGGTIEELKICLD